VDNAHLRLADDRRRQARIAGVFGSRTKVLHFKRSE